MSDPLVLSLESLRWRVGASEDEVWPELPLSAEGLRWRVGRSGSELVSED